ncbi:MAG: DUF6517 family protein [Haloferacaceae archaeon]
MPRQTTTVAAVLAVLVLTSGCIGFITGNEALELEAKKAVTDQSVANDAGYELNGSQADSLERNLSFAGVTRKVRVTNWVTTYDKSVDVPVVGSMRLAMFGIVTTPAVDVAGKARNPIGDYSNDRIIRLFASKYDGLSNAHRVGSQNLTVLGTDTEVTKYEATTTVQGRDVEVYAHVTKLRHDSDFVIAVGVYPKMLDGEQQNVFELLRAIEHPA